MILARNLLLPLNGSKYGQVVLVLVFWLCTSPILSQYIEDENDSNTETSPVTIIEKKNPYKFMDSLHYSRKAIYNIAFILPISKSKIRKGDGKVQAASMSSESREALGFWEGVNLAFRNIRTMNAKFNLHIWDNEKSDSITKNILKEMETMKFDAVVAPFHTSQAITVSKYCKEKRIPMFLAQNSSDIPAKDNPYVFKFHMPKNRLFYDYYVRVILDKYKRNSDVFYIYDGLSKSERRVANYLKYMSEKDGSRRLKLLDYNTDMNLKTYFDTTRSAVYLVSYFDTEKVNEILEKINSLRPYNVSVYGHNYWAINPKINRSLLDTLDARVFTDAYLENNPSLLSKVKSDYTGMTKDRAVTDVFLGYDVAMYIASVFNKYGVKFPLSIHEYDYNGAMTNIHIKPLYDSNGELLFFENEEKTLLRATKEGWVKEFIGE